MPSITLRDVGILSPRRLFQNLTMTIGDNNRVGLIAGNGGGKTTLLRCLAGRAEPTTGTIIRSRGLCLGYVEQDVPDNLLNVSLAEAVRRALPVAERESQQWQVDLVLDQFAAPPEFHDQPIRALSGGWQRLALIARAWVGKPDALLLDEPTNHLDLAKIQMLERWIAACRVPMVIASHDRRFLDACTNRTLFLRPDISRLYAHSYSRARELLADDDLAQEAKQAKDAQEAERLRRNANALKNVGINSGSDLLLKKSKQLRQRAAALEQTLTRPDQTREGDIRLANRGTHARLMLALSDVEVCAPDGRALFCVPRLAIFQRDRLVLLGRNGVGKSQFVQLLRRALTGEAVPGLRPSATVVMGYVDQLMSHLPNTLTPHDFVSARFRTEDQRTVRLLAGAGFTVDAQRRQIEQLSLGQKARLGLLALRLTEPNFYLMDEPTNHIDITGQERLEQEILAQDATCVVVSHDRAFVQTIGTRFLSIANGTVRELKAYEEYLTN